MTSYYIDLRSTFVKTTKSATRHAIKAGDLTQILHWVIYNGDTIIILRDTRNIPLG